MHFTKPADYAKRALRIGIYETAKIVFLREYAKLIRGEKNEC